MASPALSDSSKSTAQSPAEATGSRKAAGPPPPPTRATAPAPTPAVAAGRPAKLEVEPEPELMLERGGDEILPPPDPSELEPDLKTMPFVPGTGSRLLSTIPPASKKKSEPSMHDTFGRARSGFERAYRAGSVFIDARRAKLPGPVRKTFDRVPTSALLGLGLAIPCFALGALAVGLSASPNASESSATSDRPGVLLDVNAAAAPTAPPSPTSEPTRLATALEPANAAPAKVPATTPSFADSTDESSVLLSLADTLEAQHRDEEAVAVLDRLLARRPDLRSDARVARVLMETVYSDDRDASNGTFALLEGPMGEQGAALMYQLSRSRDVRDGPRRRAETWLKSKAFDRVAPLPLYTLVKLKYAKKCEEKRALLGLASAGGRETLDYLRELEARTTCAPDDLANCYPCMRGDSRLAESIASLEKRLGS